MHKLSGELALSTQTVSVLRKSYSRTEKTLLHSISKKKGGMCSMANMLQDQPYKNREHVLAEIRRCATASTVSSFLIFLFVIIGIISDASNTTLGLTSLTWFLLAIFAAIHTIAPSMHLVVAKHFLGIETESKKE
jgi:hypothetical protein